MQYFNARRFSVFVFFLLSLLGSGAYADQVSLVDGTTFLREKGKPVTESVSFSNETGISRFTLQLYNGGLDHSQSKVSSAVISVNGAEIFSESDFNQNVEYLEAEITLSQANQLDVLLKSKPGSQILINISTSIPNRLPVISSQPDTEALEDQSYQYQVVATDPDQLNTLTYNLVTAPDNMTMSPDGLVSWLPSQQDVGSHLVNIKVSDIEGGISNQEFELVVVNVNDAPLITSTPVTSSTQDVAYTYQAQLSDEDPNDTHIWSLTAAPDGMVVNEQSGLITWLPGNAMVGVHDVQLTVTDAQGASASQQWQVIVANINDAPVITSVPVTAALEDALYQYQLTAVDIDAGDQLTYSLVTAPGGMAIDLATGLLTWQPDNSQVGQSEITVVAKDLAGVSVSQSFTIDVANVNDAPVISSQPVTTTNEDTLWLYQIIATDEDTDDTLSFALLTAPTAMTIDSTTGLVQWTPGQSDVGVTTISVQVSDLAGAIDTQSFNLTVINVNDAPVISSQPVTTIDEDALWQYQITATDEDAQDTLSFALQTAPAAMTIDSTTGLVQWTPGQSDVGVTAISVQVSDLAGTIDTQSFNLTVVNVNDAPVISSQPVTTTDEDALWQYQITATDEDAQDTLSFALQTAPVAMTIDSTTGLVSWTPEQADVGTTDVTVLVSDAAGATDTQSFQLTVANVNDTPEVTAIAPQTVQATQSLVLAIAASDEDGEPLTYSLSAAPVGAVIDSASGEFSWTPDASQVGQYQVEVAVSDGQSSVTTVFEVVVEAPPFSAPVFTNTQDIVRFVGQQLDYQIEVESEVPYQLQLISGADGIVIDNNSGQLSWQSVAAGTTSVTLRAFINEAVFTDQVFNIVGIASQNGHAGSDFWFAFGQNITQTPGQLYVYVSSEFDTQGTIEIPADGFSETFSVTAGSVTTIEVPNEYMVFNRNGGLHNKGIHVFTDEPVVLYGLNQREFSTDGFLFYPTESLGNRYRLMTALGGQAHFVALHDNTQIQIEYAQRIRKLIGPNGFPFLPGETETITLNRGQVYGIRANDRSGGSLAGSLITSNHPIATFSGNYCKNIPEQNGACDVLEEQILPEHLLANEYVFVPYRYRFKGDIVRVVAAFDDTDIIFNGEYIATIDAGEYLEDDLEEITLISSNRPISVGQFSKGANIDRAENGGLGDPFLVQLTPLAMGLKQYQFTTPTNYVQLNAVNVVIKEEALTSLKLNGVAVDPLSFVAVPNSDYVAGSLEVEAGENQLQADDIFTISIYGYGETESYGYQGGAALPRISAADSLKISSGSASVSVGSEVCLLVQYLNGRGVPVPNMRIDVATQNAPRSLYHYVTDENGNAEHCHVGDKAMTETITASAAGLTQEIILNWQYQSSDSNRAPAWDMQNYYHAQQDVAWELPLYAADADENDDLTFALVNGPAGMYVADDGANAKLVWTANDAQLGEHIVALEAADSAGAIATTTFVVKASVGNRAPVFIQEPTDAVMYTGFFYIHPMEAFDADGDTLFCRTESERFGYSSRENVPSNCNNAFSVMPVESSIGNYDMTFYIWDRRGGEISKTFNVEVIKYEAPEIIQLPVAYAKVGTPYQTQLLVESPLGLPIRYIAGSGRTNGTISKSIDWRDMSIDSATGDFTIPLDASLVGDWDITLRYSDGLRTYSVVFPLRISSESEPFSVRLDIAPEFPQPGEEVILTPVVLGAAGGVDITLTIDGEPVSADDDGSYRIINTNDAGVYNLYLEATDSLGQTFVYNDIFSVADGNDTTAPVAALENIQDQQLITAPTDILITASDDNLARWRMYFTSVSDLSVQTQVAEGFGPLNNEFAHQLDPTLLTNGLYRLQLDVFDTSGNRTSDALVVQLDGNLKVGNYTYSVEEFTVPLAGIPITVTRTYDSRRKLEQGDFGYGWFLDHNLIKTEKSRTLGEAWQLNQYTSGPLGALKDFCVESTGDISVNITLPNDDVERFKVKASPECNTAQAVLDVKLEFEPQGDTQSTLKLASDATVRLVNGNLEILGQNSIYDPQQVVLTTREGYDYHFTFDGDVSLIEDPNNNQITFSANGIEHSSGKRISFSRNNGIITLMRDPAGNGITYQYDGEINLLSATKPLSNKESYTYDYRHGLVDIIDSLGRTRVKNIYDDAGRLIAQEDTDGNRTNFDHDIDGRQSNVTDRNGHITFLYYDDRGNVTSKVDALGNTYSYTYDGNDNQLTESDPLGNVTTRTYSANNDVLSVTDPEGNVTKYVYNARGQETQITDPAGNIFVNQYDSVGNLLTVTDPDGNLSGNNINEQGLVTLTQNSLGESTAWEYDIEGNKTKETDPVGAVTTYKWDRNNWKTEESLTRTRRNAGTQETVQDTQTWSYDRNGRVSNYFDGVGFVESLKYDTVGNLITRSTNLPSIDYEYDVYQRRTRTAYRDGTEMTHSYDAEGNKLSDTDRRGNITSYEYDVLNRLIKTTYPDGTHSSIEYDAAGRVIAEVDPRGNRTSHAYDKAGRRISTTNALNQTIEFEYDANDNLIKETDALGRVTQYSYDKQDRRTAVTYADTSSIADSYDALGRHTQMTDQAGVSTQYSYDENGRLTQVTDALGQITTYSYDEAGNKTSQTDAEGRITYWEYDARGRVIARELPGGQRETFVYDGADRISKHTNFNGVTLSYFYNQTTGYLSLIRGGDVNESYGHDAKGNRTRVSNHVGVWRYEYDSLDRVIQEEQPNGSILQYSYDAAGNKTQLIVNYANGDIRTESFAYDALNRLQSVTDSQGQTTVYGYDAVGNMVSINYPNGLVAEYSYDSLNRVTGITTKDASDNILTQYSYGLDVTGRRQSLTEFSGRSTTWTYDSLYRLTQESIVDTTHGNLLTDYVYSATGNRISQTQNSVVTNYGYDVNDRLLSEGINSYSYDAQGNLVSETDGSTTKTYSYNSRNKLMRMVDGSNSITYQYNVQGIRVNKSVNSLRTDFIVDSNLEYAQVIAEQASDESIGKEYFYGYDLVSQYQNAQTHYYHYDSLGTTRELSDAAGNLSDSYGYQAFGEIQFQSGTTDNDYLYTGEQFDADLDNYYLRARYYDQSVGRFTQMDEWQGDELDVITLNKYVYANADGINGIDPSGYFTLNQQMTALAAASTLALAAGPNFASMITSLKVDLFADGGIEYIGNNSITLLVMYNEAAAKLLELKREKLLTTTQAKSKGRGLVYHYTDRLAARAIVMMQCMLVSRGFSHPDGIYRPPGAYATRLPPWTVGSQAQLRSVLYAKPRGQKVSHFVAIADVGWRHMGAESYKPGLPGQCVPVEAVSYGKNLMLP